MEGYSNKRFSQHFTIPIAGPFPFPLIQDLVIVSEVTHFAGVFSSVSVLMDVVFGRQVHCVGVKVGRCEDVFVGISLLNVYLGMRCGEAMGLLKEVVRDERDEGHGRSWYWASITQDNKCIFAASCSNNLYVWDASSGRVRHTLTVKEDAHENHYILCTKDNSVEA
ncbi:pentatricopeptide repeat-containing protein [Tanacetum coccineum]